MNLMVPLSFCRNRHPGRAMTVSRISRNVGPVAHVTRRRVLDAVDQTGDVRNRVAGTSASAPSNLIGVVIPSLSNIVFADVLQGIDAGLAPSGFWPVVGITDYDAESEAELVTSLLAWKPAAMIIVRLDHTEVTRRRLDQSGIRVAERMDIDAAVAIRRPGVLQIRPPGPGLLRWRTGLTATSDLKLIDMNNLIWCPGEDSNLHHL